MARRISGPKSWTARSPAWTTAQPIKFKQGQGQRRNKGQTKDTWKVGCYIGTAFQNQNISTDIYTDMDSETLL